MAITGLDSKSISDMPNECKSVAKIGNRHYRLFLRLKEIETELSKIMKECPAKAKCYLRYGWMFQEPYAYAFPLMANVKIVDGKIQYEGIEEWQLVLADFYSMEANRLLKERDAILKRMYALSSRYVKRTGVGCSQFRHLRKPWFKRNGEG